ncbi:Re/Si-specific NAD(P)(+) transhydrogenase subunit alpha [Gammaproteobacteria bacterium]|nr:Re/Si-specific NAD(P)(+) transhydrogenase subunit alpha [Gammaproteobacteria bacterium]
MLIGIIKEQQTGESRVAMTPAVIPRLQALGYEVAVQQGAGKAAGFDDADYRDAGASIKRKADAIWGESDIVLCVNPPSVEEARQLAEGAAVCGFMWPGQNDDLMKAFAERKANVFAMDCVPRISRAQKLDVLSSMASVGGYRAVIEAANAFGRYFTGQITAAGKVPPAKVLVIGAGVAGLAAIGTAKGLGAIVRAFDTRPVVKDQVESMGGEFLELDIDESGEGQGGYAKEVSKEFIDAEMALFREQAADVDIIITTALIPGKPAPKLILADMVELMKPGSVIVDMAAERGGNCELSEAGKAVVKHGVTIIGYTDLTSRMATQSSQLYATNLAHYLSEITPEKNGVYALDMDDVVHRGVTAVHGGTFQWPAPPPAVSVAPQKPANDSAPVVVEDKGPSLVKRFMPVLMAAAIVLLLLLGSWAPLDFMQHFIVFVLACFIGWQVVWNVSPALHTPLMSVTNAISGIIVIGALLLVGASSSLVTALALVATTIATINIVGGFMVTRRMLNMFRK